MFCCYVKGLAHCELAFFRQWTADHRQEVLGFSNLRFLVIFELPTRLSTQEMTMELDNLRTDCARRQKKGLHFILASVLIWGLILAAHLTGLPTEQKNLITFCCSAVLFPVSWGLSKALGIDLEGKGNPLSKAGLLFSLNQLLYILIVMWVFAAVPEKMLMVYAMVFVAHLMPFSWLYRSRSYLVLSIVIPVLSLIVGLFLPPYLLAVIMVVIEALFSVCLHLEVKRLDV